MGTPAGSPPHLQLGRSKHSLWPVYHQLAFLTVVNPPQAYRGFSELIPHLDEYEGAPDVWHNLSIDASRANHEDAELAIITKGLEQWPENVDLLCDAFSLHQSAGSFFDPAMAAHFWHILDSMDRQKTARYWRFWSFGAIYLAKDLYSPSQAVKLLDEGILRVPRDGLRGVLSTYRAVLSTSAPDSDPRSDDQIRQDYVRAFEITEKRLRLGIEMGIPSAYVLAIDLAEMYEERAGMMPDATYGRSEAVTSHMNYQAAYLDRAMQWVDLAEARYTGDSNHPIWRIYIVRARILMAQRKYGDALRYLRSLPPSEREDRQIQTLIRLAAISTGERLDEIELGGPSGDAGGQGSGGGEPSRSEPDNPSPDEVLQQLFANGGRALEMLARQYGEIRDIVFDVARRLRGTGEE